MVKVSQRNLAYSKIKLNTELRVGKINFSQKQERLHLQKSVVQAIPTYTMFTSLVPKQICRDLDSLVSCFWWNTKARNLKYLELKPWKSICSPKIEGGLGFRRFEDFNLALLAKLCWKLVYGEESL